MYIKLRKKQRMKDGEQTIWNIKISLKGRIECVTERAEMNRGKEITKRKSGKYVTWNIRQNMLWKRLCLKILKYWKIAKIQLFKCS